MAIGLIAHDEKKILLLDWVERHEAKLVKETIYATGTTGGLIREKLPRLTVNCVKSGPLGGDQQIGGLIAEGNISMMVFFIDPLSPHPHDVDVKALLRLATLYNIPFACNPATAEIIAQTLQA